MGAILSLLKSSQETSPVTVPVDFAAKPTEQEAIHAQLVQITTQFPKIIQTLEQFKGCGDLIRLAISSPSKENDEKCWAAILPAVSVLKDLYEFAQKLESLFPKAIGLLCTKEAEVSLVEYQATACQVAIMICFAIQFDLVKMSNPSIQNDFSYYRRSVSRMKSVSQGQIVVSDELANRMSLFFAHSTPVTKALIDTLTTAVSMRTLNAARASDVFALLAGIAYNKLETNSTEPLGVNTLLLVLVSSILFFDHIDSAGAFTKDSKIKIKVFHKTIQEKSGSQKDQLLNVLKFSTLHLNSESTPKNIKQLFQ